jgi:Tfp pilus assembly protein PilO
VNRRALLLAGAGSLVLLLVWYFALWSPRSSALEDANDRRDTAEERNQQLDASIERLRNDQQNEPQRRATLERLRAAVPDQPNLAQFILDTNDAAVKAGIDWISIAPTPPAAATAPTAPAAPTTTTTVQAGSGVGAGAGAGAPRTSVGSAPAEIKMTMQITGGYFQVLDFLNRLNAMPRVVVVDGLNLNADQGARLTVTVTARMFVQPGAVATDGTTTTTTSTTAPAAGGTTTTAVGGATTTTAAAGATTSTTGAQP